MQSKYSTVFGFTGTLMTAALGCSNSSLFEVFDFVTPVKLARKSPTTPGSAPTPIKADFMIGTKTSRSRTRPKRIRTCPLGSHLHWDVEWLEHRLLLATVLPPTPDVTLSLGLAGVNPNIVGGSNLTIGELGVETLNVAIPQGVIQNAKLTVVLPQGLALDELLGLLAAPSLEASAGSFASILQAATIGPNGSSATFDFGTISNSDSSGSGAPTDLITLVFDVDALNVASNQNGAVDTSTATMTYSGGSATASAPATIVVPGLNVGMSIDDPNPEPGQTVTFTLVLAHAPDSTVGAFKVNLSDALPAGATYVANSLETVAGQAPSTLGSSGDTISAYYDSFPLGATSTLSFQAQVPASIASPGASTNTANVTYTTLPDEATTPFSLYDPADAHQRTGNPADAGRRPERPGGERIGGIYDRSSRPGGYLRVDRGPRQCFLE